MSEKLKDPKIVMAPMNIASMPVTIVKKLQARGWDARQIHYSVGTGHKFGYELDTEIDIRTNGVPQTQGQTIKGLLEEDFDIFHFWNRSLFYNIEGRGLSGFDIPLLKLRGKKVAFRFTGFDLRLPEWDMDVNPYSPFRYGLEPPYNVQRTKEYLNFITEYVDQFVVQDPELGQFSPRKPVILPRTLDLTKWDFVGVKETPKPLVVHAPSSKGAKGTEFVRAAVEEVQRQKYSFEYKELSGMPHAQAMEWYSKADIIIDQLLIGATGVLTLEAMALGKPCIVYLREDLFNDFYKTDDLPVGNANPDTIVEVLKETISSFERRQDLSIRGRALVEEFHDVDKVVLDFEETYRNMAKADPVVPIGYGDIDYMVANEVSHVAAVSVLQNRMINNVKRILKGDFHLLGRGLWVLGRKFRRLWVIRVATRILTGEVSILSSGLSIFWKKITGMFNR